MSGGIFDCHTERREALLVSGVPGLCTPKSSPGPSAEVDNPRFYDIQSMSAAHNLKIL